MKSNASLLQILAAIALLAALSLSVAVSAGPWSRCWEKQSDCHSGIVSLNWQ